MVAEHGQHASNHSTDFQWRGYQLQNILLVPLQELLCIFWAVFGPLSCWNIQSCCNYSFATDSWILFARICWYWVESMQLLTLTRFPLSALVMQTHSIKLSVVPKLLHMTVTFICVCLFTHRRIGSSIPDCSFTCQCVLEQIAHVAVSMVYEWFVSPQWVGWHPMW